MVFHEDSQLVTDWLNTIIFILNHIWVKVKIKKITFYFTYMFIIKFEDFIIYFSKNLLVQLFIFIKKN